MPLLGDAQSEGLSGLLTFRSVGKLKEMRDSMAPLRAEWAGIRTEGMGAQVALTRYLYLDFVGVLLMMCRSVVCGDGMPEGPFRDTADADRVSRDAKQDWTDLLDGFLIELAENTEQTCTLRAFTRSGQKPEELCRLCLPLDCTDAVARQIFSEEYLPNPTVGPDGSLHEIQRISVRTWMRFLGVSEEAVYSYLTPHAFSKPDMRKISYCLGMRALLANRLTGDFRPFLLGESLRGQSGRPRFFDALLTLGSGISGGSQWLVRTSSFGVTSVSVIEEFCVSMMDVRGTLASKMGGVLFVPGYQTTDTLKAEIYWRDVMKVDVVVLYLADFYELFRIWDKAGVKQFLVERTR